MPKKYRILLFLMIGLVISCRKKPATEVNQDFIGGWSHNVDASKTTHLSIKSNSRGYIEKYEDGSFVTDTQSRKWLIHGGVLYFGWLGAGEETFVINQYPTVATSTIINNFDTINTGERYLILSGNYYVD